MKQFPMIEQQGSPYEAYELPEQSVVHEVQGQTWDHELDNASALHGLTLTGPHG